VATLEELKGCALDAIGMAGPNEITAADVLQQEYGFSGDIAARIVEIVIGSGREITAANVAQGAEAKLEFMPVDSMQHAIVYGSTEAIAALKARMERDYRIASLVPAPSAQTALTDEQVAALRALVEMCKVHGDFSNGVTDPTGSIDEGDVRAGEIIDAADKTLRALTAAQSASASEGK
jgi:hypothetical protein